MKRLTAAILAFATVLSLSACGAKTEDVTANSKATSKAQITTTQEETTTEITTIATTTAPAEDLTSVPKIEDFADKVCLKMKEAKSFTVSCDLKGNMVVDSKTNRMIKENFKIDTTDKATHLTSSMEDLANANVKSSYEEYQSLDDGVLSTYALNKDVWQDSIPKTFIRENMAQNTINSIGMLQLLEYPFLQGSNMKNYTFRDATMARTADGGYTMSVNNGKIQLMESISNNGLSGLIRCPEIKDTLNGQNATLTNNVFYTFDKNYVPQSVSFDIMDWTRMNSFDLHVDLVLSNWDSVQTISLPNVTPTAATTAKSNN